MSTTTTTTNANSNSNTPRGTHTTHTNTNTLLADMEYPDQRHAIPIDEIAGSLRDLLHSTKKNPLALSLPPSRKEHEYTARGRGHSRSHSQSLSPRRPLLFGKDRTPRASISPSRGARGQGVVVEDRQSPVLHIGGEGEEEGDGEGSPVASRPLQRQGGPAVPTHSVSLEVFEMSQSRPNNSHHKNYYNPPNPSPSVDRSGSIQMSSERARELALLRFRERRRIAKGGSLSPRRRGGGGGGSTSRSHYQSEGEGEGGGDTTADDDEGDEHALALLHDDRQQLASRLTETEVQLHAREVQLKTLQSANAAGGGSTASAEQLGNLKDEIRHLHLQLASRETELANLHSQRESDFQKEKANRRRAAAASRVRRGRTTPQPRSTISPPSEREGKAATPHGGLKEHPTDGSDGGNETKANSGNDGHEQQGGESQPPPNSGSGSGSAAADRRRKAAAARKAAARSSTSAAQTNSSNNVENEEENVSPSTPIPEGEGETLDRDDDERDVKENNTTVGNDSDGDCDGNASDSDGTATVTSGTFVSLSEAREPHQCQERCPGEPQDDTPLPLPLPQAPTRDEDNLSSTNEDDASSSGSGSSSSSSSVTSSTSSTVDSQEEEGDADSRTPNPAGDDPAAAAGAADSISALDDAESEATATPIPGPSPLLEVEVVAGREDIKAEREEYNHSSNSTTTAEQQQQQLQRADSIVVPSSRPAVSSNSPTPIPTPPPSSPSLSLPLVNCLLDAYDARHTTTVEEAREYLALASSSTQALHGIHMDKLKADQNDTLGRAFEEFQESQAISAHKLNEEHADDKTKLAEDHQQEVEKLLKALDMESQGREGARSAASEIEQKLSEQQQLAEQQGLEAKLNSVLYCEDGSRAVITDSEMESFALLEAMEVERAALIEAAVVKAHQSVSALEAEQMSKEALEQEVAAMGSSIAALESVVSRKEEEAAGHQQKIRTLNRELEVSTRENEELTQEKAAVEEALDEARTERDDEVKRNGELADQLSSLNSEMVHQEAVMDSQAKQISALEERVEDAIAERDSTRRDLEDQIQFQADSAEDNVKDLFALVGELQQAITASLGAAPLELIQVLEAEYGQEDGLVVEGFECEEDPSSQSAREALGQLHHNALQYQQGDGDEDDHNGNSSAEQPRIVNSHDVASWAQLIGTKAKTMMNNQLLMPMLSLLASEREARLGGEREAVAEAEEAKEEFENDRQAELDETAERHAKEVQQKRRDYATRAAQYVSHTYSDRCGLDEEHRAETTFRSLFNRWQLGTQRRRRERESQAMRNTISEMSAELHELVPEVMDARKELPALRAAKHEFDTVMNAAVGEKDSAEETCKRILNTRAAEVARSDAIIHALKFEKEELDASCELLKRERDAEKGKADRCRRQRNIFFAKFYSKLPNRRTNFFVPSESVSLVPKEMVRERVFHAWAFLAMKDRLLKFDTLRARESAIRQELRLIHSSTGGGLSTPTTSKSKQDKQQQQERSEENSPVKNSPQKKKSSAAPKRTSKPTAGGRGGGKASQSPRQASLSPRGVHRKMSSPGQSTLSLSPHMAALDAKTSELVPEEVDTLRRRNEASRKLIKTMESELRASKNELTESNKNYEELLAYAEGWYRELEVYKQQQQQGEGASATPRAETLRGEQQRLPPPSRDERSRSILSGGGRMPLNEGSGSQMRSPSDDDGDGDERMLGGYTSPDAAMPPPGRNEGDEPQDYSS